MRNSQRKDLSNELQQDGTQPQKNTVCPIRPSNQIFETPEELTPDKVDPQPKIMYKMGTPHFPSDPDWTITLSKKSFPWKEVAFDDFSVEDCFQMYSNLVPDEFEFNKKVRGATVSTYKKLVKIHRNLIKYTTFENSSLKDQAEEIMRLKKLQFEEAKNLK